MRFSSFILITAAGLAIAAPITPYAAGAEDMGLTVEPTEVGKRQNLEALDTVKNTLPGGLGKRQLEGLLPTSSSEEEKEVEPKEPKEPKEPLSIADGTEETETEALPAAESSDLTGSGLLRRQIPDLNSLLGGDAAEETPAADDTAAADDEEVEDDEEADEEDDEEEKDEKKKDETADRET